MSIQISHQHTFSLQTARLLELSHNGARIRLIEGIAEPGDSIWVWLPDKERPIPALVVHTNDLWAGLLWIDGVGWVDYLYAHPILRSHHQPLPLAS